MCIHYFRTKTMFCGVVKDNGVYCKSKLFYELKVFIKELLIRKKNPKQLKS